MRKVIITWKVIKYSSSSKYYTFFRNFIFYFCGICNYFFTSGRNHNLIPSPGYNTFIWKVIALIALLFPSAMLK
jgi:hypothetical protein